MTNILTSIKESKPRNTYSTRDSFVVENSDLIYMIVGLDLQKAGIMILNIGAIIPNSVIQVGDITKITPIEFQLMTSVIEKPLLIKVDSLSITAQL